MDDADRYLLRQHIAAQLDYPSVYMGGPSAQSIRRAVAIVNMLDAGYTITPNLENESDANRVREWRKSPWDSPERV